MTRILAIDDNDLILEQLTMWFEAEGYDVISANNGRDGIREALKQPPDLIVCDISMPEINGYDVLEELRKHPETALVPFMFLSAQSDRSFVRHGMELGADDYLTKPFTRPELLAAVRTRVQRRLVMDDVYTRQLEEVKTNLARMVAHELKTPLVNIHLVKDIIERQIEHLSKGEIQALMNTLGAGTERLNHLVEQMIYVTQLDSGVLNRDKVWDEGVPVEIEQIMPGVFDLGRRFAFRNKTINIVSDARDQAAVVRAHMQALRHALAEVIANALNFSPENGEVTVSEWKADGYVWISIRDHGEGMSAQQQQRAVQAFEQVNRETHEQQGMGLGLPLVKRILDAHDGTLEIRSVEGKGTQVIIRLPVLEQSAKLPF